MRITTRLHEPFEAYIIDEFLEPSRYQELFKAFPREGFRKMEGVGDKQYINDRSSNYRTILKERPIWQEFYNEVQSKAFKNRMREIADFPAEAHARMEFSYLPGPGGHILPHPDVTNKVCSLVLYMADHEWPEGEGGMHCFSRKDGTPEVKGYQGKFENFDTALYVPYGPNRLVGFVRSNISYHGVLPIKYNQPRYSITIAFRK